MIESFKRLPGTTKVFLGAVAALVLFSLGLGLYGLLKGPPTPVAAPGPAATTLPSASTEPSLTEPSTGAATPEPPAELGGGEGHAHGSDMHGGEGLAPPEEEAGMTLPDLPASADPVTFATTFAKGMFEFKTTDGLMPLDYIQRLMRVADPSGQESAGLRQDLERWLSQPEVWKELQGYKTTQWIEIDKAVVPAAWADALAQDTAGRIKPGTTAVTIDAKVKRTGTVDGKVDEWQMPFALTLFVTCRPTFETCHAMRISYLNDVLR